MAEFWLDCDALITPKNNGWAFDLAPRFWAFLLEQADAGVIRSPIRVHEKLTEGTTPDELAKWVTTNKGRLFLPPSKAVQDKVTEIADYVNSKCDKVEGKRFLDDADPWLIAHACVDGGRIVTFETHGRSVKEVKIPDIAKVFGAQPPMNTWALMRHFGQSWS